MLSSPDLISLEGRVKPDMPGIFSEFSLNRFDEENVPHESHRF